MDIWTHNLSTALGMGFIPAWLLIIVAGILSVRSKSRPEHRPRTKRIATGLTALVVAYFALLVLAALSQKLAVGHRFHSLVTRPPDALPISSPSNSVTLSDTAAVTELLRMIDKGDSVWAHHSYPIKEIHLSFPQIGYTYALGRDSERDSEFWLKWVAYPGSGAPRDLAPVRQFRSEELRRWLETSGHVGGG